MTARIGFLDWDWREQPDLAELERLVSEISGGTLHIQEVETGSDQYTIAVSTVPVTVARATELWLEHQDGIG